MAETDTAPDSAAVAASRPRQPGRVGAVLLPVIAVIVAVFGLSLGTWLPGTVTVSHWNVAWVGYDLVFAGLIASTWLAARAGKWWAIACAGAVNAFQIVDVWFSLLIFYDLSQRPFIGIWAFVMQPIFAVIIWRFVLARLRDAGSLPALAPTS